MKKVSHCTISLPQNTSKGIKFRSTGMTAGIKTMSLTLSIGCQNKIWLTTKLIFKASLCTLSLGPKIYSEKTWISQLLSSITSQQPSSAGIKPRGTMFFRLISNKEDGCQPLSKTATTQIGICFSTTKELSTVATTLLVTCSSIFTLTLWLIVLKWRPKTLTV